MELILKSGRESALFSNRISMENIWLGILKEALNDLAARIDSPVGGAKLRTAVKKLAEDRGEQFPPEGMTKWTAFLESFPSDITVIRVPGSDVLVVPADRPDLQAIAVATAGTSSTAHGSSIGRIRSDIFEALTRIPKPSERAVYLPDADAVLWLKVNEIQPPNSVQFPLTTLDAEIALRRKFAESGGSVTEAAKNALNQACYSEGPLRQFTQAIRSYGLIQDWHVFRMNALLARLREWAQSNELQFRDEWAGVEKPQGGGAIDATSATINKRGLVELAGLLSDDDIARISVPLDVVLRLLSTR